MLGDPVVVVQCPNLNFDDEKCSFPMSPSKIICHVDDFIAKSQNLVKIFFSDGNHKNYYSSIASLHEELKKLGLAKYVKSIHLTAKKDHARITYDCFVVSDEYKKLKQELKKYIGDFEIV